MSQPTVLMDDSLRSLNQYVLLEPPTSFDTGNPRHGDLVPLRVHRRGDPNEGELTLAIPLEMLPAIADFFQHIAERFGKN
jgi:hypothetical protein